MTIASTRTEEPTVDELCIDALEIATITSAGQTPQPRQLGQARRFLQNVLKDLANYGVFARDVTMYELPLVVGTYKYDMPTYTVDVVSDAMYIDVGETDLSKANGETIVEKQSRDNWQRNGAKGATGQPTLYFLNRAEVPAEVWLWPIPEEAGTIRFQIQRKKADVSDGSTTIDMETFWDNCVIHLLAAMLAEAAGFNAKANSLDRKASRMRTMARATANQGVNTQMSPAPGSYRRRR